MPANAPRTESVSRPWMSTWRVNPLVTALEEGTRGDGADRGLVGVADFPAGIYPACSRHGALIRVGAEPAIWRCLVHSCNAGAMTPTPWCAHKPTIWERGPEGELLMPDGTPFYDRLEHGGSVHVRLVPGTYVKFPPWPEEARDE